MTTNDQILKLFDELDAFEAADLIEQMADRGYELKINRSLSKEHTFYGLYLVSYNDDHKIPAIKAIRNTPSDYKDLMVGGVNFGLKEAKDFSEQPNRWPKEPIAWGKKYNLKSILDILNREHSGIIKFELKEISVENFNRT
jgi:ribosomal protein L7/L12